MAFVSRAHILLRRTQTLRTNKYARCVMRCCPRRSVDHVQGTSIPLLFCNSNYSLPVSGAAQKSWHGTCTFNYCLLALEYCSVSFASSSNVGCQDPASTTRTLCPASTLRPTHFLLAVAKHEVWCVADGKKILEDKWEAAHGEFQQEPAVRIYAAKKRSTIESPFDQLVRKQGAKNSDASRAFGCGNTSADDMTEDETRQVINRVELSSKRSKAGRQAV